MATSPHTHPLLYKSISVNGTDSPGVVTLSDFPREQDVEEQRAKGTTGATTLNRGAKVGRFTASFYLVDDDDFDAWDDFQKQLKASTEGPKPKVLLVYHPDLVRNGWLDFQVTSISGMQYDGRGGATVVCKFLEYRPAKPRPAAKAEAGKGAQRTGTTTVQRSDPNAERKRELAALTAQAKQP